MRKLLILILMLALSTTSFAADEWNKGSPTGASNVSDLDTNIGKNNEALDRLLSQYPKGITLSYSSSAAITASTGGVACSNSDGSVRKMRNNTSTTNVSFADIDTGAEASSTTYYVYANCDADATTATFKISANATTPTGVTSYKRIGSFYNDASSNISTVTSDLFPFSLGNYETKSNNTVYQAPSDGFVTVKLESTGPYNYCHSKIYADSSSSPSTIRGYVNTHEDTDWDRRSTYDTTTIPIRKGDYWKVVYTASEGSSTQTIYWMPLR